MVRKTIYKLCHIPRRCKQINLLFNYICWSALMTAHYSHLTHFNLASESSDTCQIVSGISVGAALVHKHIELNTCGMQCFLRRV